VLLPPRPSTAASRALSPTAPGGRVGAAWQAGFRAVDTALTYFDQAGVAEGIAAAAAKHPRADIFVTTKV
jgi:diketogulonate reductase-like aldo/keto reductase